MRNCGQLCDATGDLLFISAGNHFQLPFYIKASLVTAAPSFAKMVRYERLDGDEEEGRSGGGANISLKRNLLVVLLALVLFATILGNILLHFSTQLCL